MADSNTLRILSLDGGGTRGILSATFMKRFVELWGINPNEIWKHFDVICGTSIGGIMALGYSTGLSTDEVIDFVRTKSPWIFTTSNVIPGIRPTTLDKFATMILGGTFYPNTNLKAELASQFGTDTMDALLTNTLITSYDYTTDTPILFSNIVFPSSSGEDELLANVALATSAAPLYLPMAEWPVGEGMSNKYSDGACIKNNPEGLGYALGKILKPSSKRVCILSCGTGLGDIGFHTVPVDPPPDEFNMSFIFSLLGILITGAQETDSEMFNLIDQYSLEQLYRYRFQTLLPTLEDTEIDNSDSDYFDRMQALVNEYFDEDIMNISNFLAHLMA